MRTEGTGVMVASDPGYAPWKTILGDGSVVVVVLNPAGLIQNCRPDSVGHTVKRAGPAPPALAPNILVADDSITARTLEIDILEAQCYRVRVALDGVAGRALELAPRSAEAP